MVNYLPLALQIGGLGCLVAVVGLAAGLMPALLAGGGLLVGVGLLLEVKR